MRVFAVIAHSLILIVSLIASFLVYNVGYNIYCQKKYYTPYVLTPDDYVYLILYGIACMIPLTFIFIVNIKGLYETLKDN